MTLPTSGSPPSNVCLELRDAIATNLPGADVRVSTGSPGHFNISVVSEEFRGKTRLACQRLVYKAIARLMQGDRAPVHAVDQLETNVP
jgi:acid stress-induced BolA-like protein IbaG/YrbA